MAMWQAFTFQGAAIILYAIVVSCTETSPPSGNAPPVEVSKINLQGQWSLTKVTSSDTEKAFTGKLVVDITSNDTLVRIQQGFAFTGKDPCTHVSEEKISSVEDGKITLALNREIGAKKCLLQNYDPTVLTVKSLTADNLLLENKTSSLYFSRRTSAALGSYEELAKKFEFAEATINDPDKTQGFELKYRNPNFGGWKHLCPRLAGAYYTASGFGTNPTFLHGDDVYEVSMDFDEGEIVPLNYSGPTPDFRIQKRASTSSDSVSYTGPSLYYCSSLSSCASKCTLTFEDYSLVDSKAKMKIECTQLPSSSTTDPLNKFGNELSGFSLSINCNYKPVLISE